VSGEFTSTSLCKKHSSNTGGRGTLHAVSTCNSTTDTSGKLCPGTAARSPFEDTISMDDDDGCSLQSSPDRSSVFSNITDTFHSAHRKPPPIIHLRRLRELNNRNKASTQRSTCAKLPTINTSSDRTKSLHPLKPQYLASSRYSHIMSCCKTQINSDETVIPDRLDWSGKDGIAKIACNLKPNQLGKVSQLFSYHPD
jgi:hypothetical protein